MSVTQGPVRVVKPRDLADWPVFAGLARFFWGCAALLMAVAAGFFFLVSVVNSADSEGWRSPWPILRTPVTQLAVAAVVLGGLYFAPGFRRLARTTRLALLGPLACAVPVFVVLWPCAVAA
ncbi:hypothetical protein HEP87_31635 [Streptomyces sp. S1D4-11]|nr:hypothetical protein [Streptomyces sp. S1D4-11]QIY97695.1 hypothetical protein HEP87_31635 [Streptomyces sp. S1D4-11]